MRRAMNNAPASLPAALAPCPSSKGVDPGVYLEGIGVSGPRQLAPPRASALYQSSFRNLRLRFNYRSQMSQLTVTHPTQSASASEHKNSSSAQAMMSDSSSSLIGVPDSDAAGGRRARLCYLLDELFEWIAHGSNSGRRRDACGMRASTQPSLVVRGHVALERSSVPSNERMNRGRVITVRPLYVRNQSPLRAGVAVDVAFGRLDGAMARRAIARRAGCIPSDGCCGRRG